uniref:Sperm-associated antigen 16 protein-like n=1 Tax=Castor canadensis TaxID=51338 RepID=A0A8B7TSI6_CASCN|nr:sperm-associated antigen 16 protein-like [Castor canadensis]
MEQGSDPWGQNGQAQYKLHRCLLHLFKKAGRISNLELSGKGHCEQSLYGHMHSINDATFTPRGHIIASCDSCGVLKLWDFRKLLPIVSIDVGPSPGNEVNFDSTGRVLAQASGNGVIHLLDLKSGQIHKLMGHESEAHTVVFSQDGENLYSGGSDGTIRSWS